MVPRRRRRHVRRRPPEPALRRPPPVGHEGERRPRGGRRPSPSAPGVSPRQRGLPRCADPASPRPHRTGSTTNQRAQRRHPPPQVFALRGMRSTVKLPLPMASHRHPARLAVHRAHPRGEEPRPRCAEITAPRAGRESAGRGRIRHAPACTALGSRLRAAVRPALHSYRVPHCGDRAERQVRGWSTADPTPSPRRSCTGSGWTRGSNAPALLLPGREPEG